MANAAVPVVKVYLGGEQRLMRLDFNAIAALEEQGVKLLEGFKPGDMNAKTIRLILWAASQHLQPAPTIEEVGSWITIRDLPDLTEALDKLMTSSLPEALEVDPLAVPANGSTASSRTTNPSIG